jgi:hypothetical protein
MQRLFSIIPAAIALVSALVSWTSFAEPARAQSRTAQEQLAVDIYKELVEINTVNATGDTARAAEAMAARLRSAGPRIGCPSVHARTTQGQSGGAVARDGGAQADPTARTS